MSCSSIRGLVRLVHTCENHADLERSLAAARPLFAACGDLPCQDPQALAGRLLGADCVPGLVYLWPQDEPRLILALRPREQGVWQALFSGAPLLVDPQAVDCCLLGEILAQILADTGADVLYFPLVYPETGSAQLLARVPGALCWERSPSPVIAWQDAGQGMAARFHQRYGSQAARKEKRWRSCLQAVTLPPREAVRALARIEATSWKAELRADLGASGQLASYRVLLQAGLVELAAAMYGAEPIAYRLDWALRDTVYVLEWSFEQRYAPLAPGMFLLVKGLVQRWGTVPLTRIDLSGSPDLLKSLIETGRRPRRDIAWPAGSAALRLCTGESGHDAHLARCLSQGIGIRRASAGESHPGQNGGK
jgi:hypothetical protein